jgi:rhodanese-related sulfurtransferase
MTQLAEFFHNHLILFAGLGGLLVLFIANEIHGQVAGGKRLAPPEAVRMINDRDIVVVDLRPAADFKKGHLMNALNLPVGKLVERAGELPKDKSKPLLLYCALGGVAAEAAAKLRKLGYAEVYPLRGGLNGWLASNLPVTVK